MNDQTDDSVKAGLLGAVVPIHATGDHTPDPARLAVPLEGPGSVMRSFCTGCGQYYELTAAGVEQIAESSDISLGTSLEGAQFLQVASCSQCDGIDSTVKLIPIDNLLS
ncbi:MAG: hypothetical protein WC693_04120 [Patescibacteria group bacterium]|jgi:hypothetical protein